MTDCLLCATPMTLLRDDVRDWEYGVRWHSSLLQCPGCGLVTQEPPIQAAQVPSLYPDNYLAHSGASSKRGIYGQLKELLARRTATKIARHVRHGGTLLEVGCGNGHLLRRIAGLRPDLRLIGVDIEDTGITDLPNFSFYHGQFEQAGIAPGSVDLVYCSNLIEHVPDPLLFARKVRAVLQPEGALLGVTPDHLSLDRYVFGKYWAGYHYPRHTFIFNHANIVSLLQSAGFEDVTVRGAYSFWYLSLANRFMELPGTKRRGMLFAAVTAFFLPFDLLVNLVRCHGSMTFLARIKKG